jgi:hypothetical protein
MTPEFLTPTLFDTYVLTSSLVAIMIILLGGLFKKTVKGMFWSVIVFSVLCYFILVVVLRFQLIYGNLSIIEEYNDKLLFPSGTPLIEYLTIFESANRELRICFVNILISDIIGLVVGLGIRAIVLKKPKTSS